MSLALCSFSAGLGSKRCSGAGAKSGRPMAKGCWIAHVDVDEPDAYTGSMTANAAASARFGARFPVRAGPATRVEGHFCSRHVLAFEDYETAPARYTSPDHAAALAIRHKSARAEVLIVDGYDEVQRRADL